MAIDSCCIHTTHHPFCPAEQSFDATGKTPKFESKEDRFNDCQLRLPFDRSFLLVPLDPSDLLVILALPGRNIWHDTGYGRRDRK